MKPLASKKGIGNKFEYPLTILEREASEEESNMNVIDGSVRSPMSGSLDP